MTEAEYVGLCALGEFGYYDLAMVPHWKGTSVLQKLILARRPYREPVWPEDLPEWEISSEEKDKQGVG